VAARKRDLRTVYKMCTAPANLHDMHNRIISVVLCALSLNLTKCVCPSLYDTLHCGDVNQTDVYFSRHNVGILVSVRRHYLNINFTSSSCL
jgi:hypothetical protein